MIEESEEKKPMISNDDIKECERLVEMKFKEVLFDSECDPWNKT